PSAALKFLRRPPDIDAEVLTLRASPRRASIVPAQADKQIAPAANPRIRLRTKLIRAMVGTLAVVFGATLLVVGYLNYRSARAPLETIERQIQQSITRKGQGLVNNHALALRPLVADNAFGDVGRLVHSAVRQDDEMVYGLFLGADGRPWAYVRGGDEGAAG